MIGVIVKNTAKLLIVWNILDFLILYYETIFAEKQYRRTQVLGKFQLWDHYKKFSGIYKKIGLSKYQYINQ